MTWRRWSLLLVLPALLGASPPGTVEIAVTGVRSSQGQILVAVCDRATFLARTCAYRGRAPAQAGSVVVRVEGVPPGVYAAQAFQDENGNGRIDRSLFGIPQEGIGFSRNAPMRFGPPRFDDAAFTLVDSANLTLALRYFD